MENFICIVCPKGCRLSVDDSVSPLLVSGEGCRRGIDYAIAETTDPRRNISSTVAVVGGFKKRVSIKTSAPIKKEMIFPFMEFIHGLKPTAPVKCGDILAVDVLGSGADIVATSEA